jgi:hypothetical protein
VFVTSVVAIAAARRRLSPQLLLALFGYFTGYGRPIILQAFASCDQLVLLEDANASTNCQINTDAWTLSLQGSDPTLSPIPTPPPRQGEWSNQAAPSPPLPAPSAPREMPEGGRVRFRLFEVGSGSEAAGVVDVERGTNFEQFRAECMATIGCGIAHCKSLSRSWRFPLIWMLPI